MFNALSNKVICGIFVLFSSSTVLAGTMSNEIILDKASRPWTVLIGGEFGASELAYSGSPLVNAAARSQNPALYRDLTQSSQLFSIGSGVHLGFESLVWKGLSFGTELGYKNYGSSENKIDLTDRTIKRIIRDTDYDALLLGRYTWLSGVNVFAKGGVAYTDTHLSQGPIPDPRNPGLKPLLNQYNIEFLNIVPELVVGIGFKISDLFNIYANYTYVAGYNNLESDEIYNLNGILNPPSKVANLNMLSLGLELMI